MGSEKPNNVIDRIGAALERDTRVNLHRSPVTVSMYDEYVLLQGEMEDIAQKRAAVDAAARVLTGMHRWTIDDRLSIRPSEHKEDLELKEEVDAALSHESAFRDYTLATDVAGNIETIHDAGDAGGSIKAGVDNGSITLSGRVESLTHLRLAEVLMWWTTGCRFVDNRLEVLPPEEDTDDEINDAVRIVLEKDPLVHADQLQVGTAGGVVILSGSVATREEKRFAILDAWYVPGVSDVVDRVDTRA